MLGIIAITISLAVGILAATSLGIALDARQQVADTRAQMASRPTAAGADPSGSSNYPPAASGTTAPPTELIGPDETPTRADVLNPQAVYEPVYAGEMLNPQATSSGETQIDLDEPRVGADHNNADIELRTNYNSDVPLLSLKAEDQAAAEAGNPELTPQDCADLIRTSPLPGDARIPAQQGTILCVTTSPTQAAAEGISQRIVVIEVTALSDDGRITIAVSAWQVSR